MMLYFLSTDVITFEEYAGQAVGALTNNHSPSLNSVKHPSGIHWHTNVKYPGELPLLKGAYKPVMLTIKLQLHFWLYSDPFYSPIRSDQGFEQNFGQSWFCYLYHRMIKSNPTFTQRLAYIKQNWY